jgi:hypothetical protein
MYFGQTELPVQIMVVFLINIIIYGSQNNPQRKGSQFTYLINNINTVIRIQVAPKSATIIFIYHLVQPSQLYMLADVQSKFRNISENSPSRKWNTTTNRFLWMPDAYYVFCLAIS